MINDMWTNGCILVRILDKTGQIKRRAPPGYSRLGWDLWQTAVGRCLKKLLVFFGSKPWPDQFMEDVFFHVITWEWSDLAGNLLGDVDHYIQVGTGGDEGGILAYRAQLRCKKPVGVRKMDKGYPDWNMDPENGTIVYSATFPAGSIKNKSINEVCLYNGDDPVNSGLVYGQLIPGVSLGRGDTLQVLVEVLYAVPEMMVCEEI